MSLTLAQIRTVKSRDQWLTDMIGVLAGVGFNSQSWQPGSVQRTIVECFAYVANTLNEAVAAISKQTFNETSEGDALTAFSLSHYSNTRKAAVATRGTERLTGGAVGPPYNVTAGALTLSTAGGVRFRNLEAFTVPASGTVDIVVEAETPGIGGNVGDGTITQLVTPLVGVTATNLAGWRTVTGTNEETDAALRARNSSKWSTLSIIEAVDDRYEYIARQTIANCRVLVDSSNPDGPGTVRIYLALETGAASSGDAVSVNDAIALQSFGGPDGALAPYHSTIPASSQTINFIGTVFYSATLTTAAACQTAVEAALRAYVNAAPIGGYSYGSGANNIMDRDGLIDAVRNVTGVKKVTLTTPSGDTNITPTSVAVVGSFTITYTAVP